jgi:proline iminopeptidase
MHVGNLTQGAEFPGGSLFPEIVPFRTGMLPVDGLHVLYWEESGNPAGIPVVFLHGGPGAGSSPRHRQFFDPAEYRIIIFDQRGAGRSTPNAELRDNTTWNLVEDLELLRAHLQVDSWLMFGGSWGSTLALAYAEQNPMHCRGLVLRGIFLCTQREIDWFMSGMGRFFPEHWERFLHHFGVGESGNLLRVYHSRLTNSDPDIHLPAARAWCAYETACSTLLPQATHDIDSAGNPELAMARLEAHYFVNRGFFSDGWIIQHANRLVGIPGVIVQGRYDMVCPVEAAFELSRAWPDAQLRIVEDAGHSAWEPGIQLALVTALNQFAKTGYFS